MVLSYWDVKLFCNRYKKWCAFMLNCFGKINPYVKAFKSDDVGAVTVDWVVLTALIVGMVVFVIQQVTLPVEALSTVVEDGISTNGGVN